MTITAPTTMATPCCCHCFCPQNPPGPPPLLSSGQCCSSVQVSFLHLKGKITVWFFLRRVNQKEALLGFSLLSFQFSVATTSNKMSFSLAQASRSEFPRSLFPFRFLNFLFDDVWCCFPFTASSKSQPSFRSLFFF